MENETTPWYVLPTKLYDFLKFMALVVLPAFSTLYFTLGALWDWNHVETVIGSMSAIDVFLGVVLKAANAGFISSGAGLSGAIDISEDEFGKKTYSLVLNDLPEAIDKLAAVTFKVNSPTG